MQKFATEQAFTNAVGTALGSTAVADTIRAALVSGVNAGEAERRSDIRLNDGALNLRINDWVLREQDMPVLELIGMVGAAVTAVVAPGAIAAGAVVTALSSFATLCWKTWRKGAPLSKAEIAVLGFLQVNGPMSQTDLEAKASSVLDLKPEDIGKAVLTLQEVQLRDGEIVPLIRKDAADQWRAQTY